MKPTPATERALAAGYVLLVVCAVFFVVSAAQVPTLFYVPALHTWTFHPPPRHIGMDWYFRAGAALASGLVAAPIATWIARKTPPARMAGATRLVFGLALGILFWCSVYLAFALATAPRGHAPVTHDEG